MSSDFRRFAFSYFSNSKKSKMKKVFILSILIVSILTSCNQPKEENQETKTYLEESHSYAQPNDAVITHLDLDKNDIYSVE